MAKPQTPDLARGTWLLALGIPAALVVTALLSWPALTGPFLFDDFPNLAHLAVLDGRLDWNSLANYSAQFRGEPGRPLSMLSFVINDYDWPSSPWSFKYTNLLLHLLVGVLVFGCARSLTLAKTSRFTHANGVALLTMSAWLLHPMQMSTTMLVVQRMTQLSACFAFAGIWGYLALARRANTPARAMGSIAALGLGTVLALLSKETGALTPLLAVVINATLLRDELERLPSLPRKIVKAGTTIPVVLLVAAVFSRLDVLTVYGNRPFDMAERLLSQARVLCHYLYDIIVPNLRGGGIYHDDFVVSRGLLDPITTLPAVLCIGGLVLTGWFVRRRAPLLAFGLLWFFAGHLLESTIFPLEMYFEHRNYMPMFGILYALAAWVVEASRRRVLLAAACLWVAFAALLTAVQAPIWGNKDALISVWAIEHPDSARAVQQKAANLYDKGQYEAAGNTLLDAYTNGVTAADFPVQVLLLACIHDDRALARRARPFVAQALSSGGYTRAMPITIRKIRFQVQRAACGDLVSEEKWLSMTDRILDNPNYSTGEAAAYIHTERSYFFRSKRDLNATMNELEKAWAAQPSPELAQMISETLASAGLYDEALEWADRALEHRVRGVRGLLSNDDVTSRRLRTFLEKRSAQQR